MQSFVLRPWRLQDAASLVRYADDPHIAANLRDGFPSPFGMGDAEAFIAVCRAADPACDLYCAIDVAGEAVGSIGLFRKDNIYRKSAETGYWLARAYWGRGIMTEALRRICATGFARWDIVRIFAEPFAHNRGSRNALERAGFALEGILRQSVYKNGALADSCIYARLEQINKT